MAKKKRLKKKRKEEEKESAVPQGRDRIKAVDAPVNWRFAYYSDEEIDQMYWEGVKEMERWNKGWHPKDDPLFKKHN